MNAVEDSNFQQLDKEWREDVAGRFVDRYIGMVSPSILHMNSISPCCLPMTSCSIVMAT